MKKLLVLMLILFLAAASAQAYNWSNPILVADRDYDSSQDNVVAENGMVVIADSSPRQAGTPYPYVYVNAYSYTAGDNGSLTKTIDNQGLGGAESGTWGVKISGVGIDDGIPVVATAAWAASNTNARVFTRSTYGGWTYVDASANLMFNDAAGREAFQLDADDEAYQVYLDITGFSGYDIMLATAAHSKVAGPWSTSILSTPAYPMTVAGGYAAAAKVALDEDTTVTPYTSYMADQNPHYPFPWYTDEGSGAIDTTMSSGTSTSRCDIEIDSLGNPMVAAMNAGNIQVAFYDGVTPYTTSTVCSAGDGRAIGWYNTADHVDLEIDGDGNPVVLVARADNADPSLATSTDLEYYVYSGGIWTGGVILNVIHAAGHISSPDLTFDESGRPFIVYSAFNGETTRDLYMITDIDPCEPLIITPPAPTPINWSDPVVIGPRATNSGSGNIVAENGKVAVADAIVSAVGTWPQVHYNELTYTPGGIGSLTHTIQDEPLGGSEAGTYGTRIEGIGLVDGQPVIATAAWSATSTNGRVYSRHFGGTYSYVTAIPSILDYGHAANREAFQLDADDKPYYVYTDSTGFSGQDIVIATAASCTSTSWTQTIKSTPAYPTSSDATSAKIALDESGATPASIVSYLADQNPSYPFPWYTDDGTGAVNTTMSTGTPTSRCDMEIGPDGNPIVAAYNGSGVTVAFYDDVTGSYSTSLVVADSPYDIGWLNTADYIDLEIDGEGRPVVLVSSLDYGYLNNAQTEAYLDYYVMENGAWTAQHILTFPVTAGQSIGNPDLTFDENGRPFITFNANNGETARQLYLVTEIDPCVPTVITPPAQTIDVNWADEWILVDDVDDSISQLAMAIANGKIGLTYQYGSVGGAYTQAYTEFAYSGSSISVQIQDEDVPGAVGYWGTQIRGIDFAPDGNAVIGAIGPIGNPSNDAYVLSRLGGGLWGSEKASVGATLPSSGNYGEYGSWENFALDPSGKEHFVWNGNDANELVYAEKTTGSWVVTTMATTGTMDLRSDMALDDSNNPHIVYTDKDGSTISAFYTDDLVTGEVIGTINTGNPPARQDIEMNANGYPMIVYYGSGIVYTEYNGSEWVSSNVVPSAGFDGRAFGWVGTGYFADLELDPADGLPVVVLSYLDDYDLGTDANTVVEYCKLYNTGWVKETIGNFESGGNCLQGLDLVFDEDNRPFVAIVVKEAPDADPNVLLLAEGISTDPQVCGEYGTLYHDYDFDKNCYVDFGDLKVIAADWLECTTPEGVGCAVAPGADVPPPYDIYPGTATIDGDLSDWADVQWIAMDMLSYGAPTDLSNAEWAARWDDASNRILLAVRGTDTFHFFSDYPIQWDGQDSIEVYVDANNSDATPLVPFQFKYAQQWTIGPDADDTNDLWGGGEWVNISYGASTPTGYTAAVDVTGNVISYELALPPFALYYAAGTPANVEVDLAVGLTVGLDVIMGTRTSSSGQPYDFGMVCENTVGGKYDNASLFPNFTLKAAGTGSCGDWGYLDGDLDPDCVVNLGDFAVFAEEWMACTDPAGCN